MDVIIQPIVAAATNPEFSEVMWDVVRSEGVYFTFAYFVLKKYLRGVGVTTKKREATLKMAMAAYNVFMTLYSCVTFLVMLKLMLFDLTTFTNDCDSMFRNRAFYWTTYIFYWSKHFEYLDTLWLVMRGKPVSFLQAWHHVGAPWDLWFHIMYNVESVWVFVLFNSFIHTIMYAYYTASTFKIHIPGKWLLTSMQITQFITGFTIMFFYKNVPCFGESYKRMFAWWFTWFYVGMVLLLFVNFFFVNYIKKARAAASRKAASKPKKE